MTAEAAAWPWRVALETLGHDAAAAPPHTLAKLIEGEKLPWVVARVEKALRREDDAADAVFASTQPHRPKYQLLQLSDTLWNSSALPLGVMTLRTD